MILLQFKAGQEWHLGVKTKKGVLDVTAGLNNPSTRQSNAGVPSSLAAVCSGGLAVCELLEQFVQQLLASDSAHPWLLDEATLTHGPCVANPGKIICIGLNYRRHVEESAMTIPTLPVLFSKFS